MRLRHVLLGAAAAVALVASQASAASLLNVRAVGTVSGFDGSGLLGLAGANYVNASFLLTSTLDLTRGVRDVTANRDQVYGFPPNAPGMATIKAGGNISTWGSAFSAISTYFIGSDSDVYVSFQNQLGVSDVTVHAGRHDLSFTSLNSLPTTNLCIGSAACNVTIINYGATGSGVTYVVGNLSSLTVSAAVPEPNAWALMIAGFATAGFALRRRRRVFA